MWGTISDVVREFARWWLKELRALLALAFPRIAHVGRRPVLFRGESGWRLAFPDGRSVQEFEARHPSAPACDLAVPSSECLMRQLALPAASREKLHAMARLDLERGTPLKPDDVLSGIRIEAYDRDARQLRISHYIVKRGRLAGLLERAGETGLKIGSPVVFPNDDRTTWPVELEAKAGLSTWSRSSIAVGSLASLALILSVSALLLHASGQRDVLDRLDASIAEQRALAKPVLDAVERNKAEAGKRRAIAKEVASYRLVVAVLDEVTTLLPDDVWVTSLNVAGNRVELSGFAPSAANLVKLIEVSPSFATPSLTSPIMYDRNQGKEQFTIAFERREE